MKINISVPNLRLFVGNIPKSKGKEEILDEFGKLTGNYNWNLTTNDHFLLVSKKQNKKTLQNLTKIQRTADRNQNLKPIRPTEYKCVALKLASNLGSPLTRSRPSTSHRIFLQFYSIPTISVKN